MSDQEIVWDILNVASIHNTSTSSTPSNSTLATLQSLASTHEFNLAFNSSDTTRAIAGMQLAGEILNSLSSLISSSGSSQKLNVQFGAYATFMSLFGLTNLANDHAELKNIVDYASSMAFELFTDADASSGFPAKQDLQVRFLFHNGTASNTSEPTTYRLFGAQTDAIAWSDFESKLGAFAVRDTKAWCGICGNSDGVCAAFTQKASAKTESKKNELSPAVGGVIGAFVTLAVVLGALAAGMVLGGFAVVRKKKGGEKDVMRESVETKA
jgi:hypothetical protein